MGCCGFEGGSCLFAHGLLNLLGRRFEYSLDFRNISVGPCQESQGHKSVHITVIYAYDCITIYIYTVNVFVVCIYIYIHTTPLFDLHVMYIHIHTYNTLGTEFGSPCIGSRSQSSVAWSWDGCSG